MIKTAPFINYKRFSDKVNTLNLRYQKHSPKSNTIKVVLLQIVNVDNDINEGVTVVGIEKLNSLNQKLNFIESK